VCSEITEGIDLDVREIDAATYTGVDNIRDLRDVTQFHPARDRYRIFIIDEAHMLSVPSWNALLKLIEEPPPHVIFMFATTEMQKVPATILSRVQKFALRKITVGELTARLRHISEAEGIGADDAALEMIARRGEGSVRDALSLLDQIVAFSGRSITYSDVAAVLGLSDSPFFARVLNLIGDGDHAGILDALEEAAESGRDFKMLYRDLLNFVRNLLLAAAGAGRLVSPSPEELALAEKFSYSELLRIANLLVRDDDTVNHAEHQRLAVEVALLKAATFPRLRTVEEILSGAPAPSPAKQPERAAVGGGAPLTDFIQRVQKARPSIGSYLANAKSSRTSGDRLVFTFTDSYYAEAVSEAREALEKIAADVYGAPMKVEVEAAEEKPPAATPGQTQLREDPVLKAFQKHLGGEVVDSRRSK
jgi:DNA polymerase-3 subunit gamma/tau